MSFASRSLRASCRPASTASSPSMISHCWLRSGTNRSSRDTLDWREPVSTPKSAALQIVGCLRVAAMMPRSVGYRG